MTGSKGIVTVLPKDVLAMIHNMARFEKKFRDKGVDDLKAYLERPGPIPQAVMRHNSLLVIWRGLHVAMVQQEDPILQEELADRIGSLVYCFKKEKSVNAFIKAAIETFAREWDKFNVYMVDKLMMFFRRVIRHAIFRLADNRWEHTELFVQLLKENIIRPDDDKNEFPLSPKLHLASFIMEELAKGSNEYLTEEVVIMFLKPYFEVVCAGKVQDYQNAVTSDVFEYLLRQSDAGIDARADLLNNEFPIDEVQDVIARHSQAQREKAKQKRIARRLRKQKRSGEDPSDQEMDSDSDDDEEQVEHSDEDDASDNEEELEDEEMENEEEIEEEEEEDLPLDPRAGDVHVVLPQLPVDYKKIAKALFDMMQETHLGFYNKKRVKFLMRQFQDVSEGTFTMATHPSVVNNTLDDPHDKQLLRSLYLRGMKEREFVHKETKRGRSGGKNKKERLEGRLKHDKRMVSVVGKRLKTEKSRIMKAVDEQRKVREGKVFKKRMKFLTKSTKMLKNRLELNRLKSTNQLLGRKELSARKTDQSTSRKERRFANVDSIITKKLGKKVE